MKDKVYIQKSENQKRKTVKDYIMHVEMLEGKSFKHQPDGRVYTIKKIKASKDFERMYAITDKGVRIPLENCFLDLEATQEQLAKLEEKNFVGGRSK